MYLLNYMPSYFSLKTLRIVGLFLYMRQKVYLSWSTRCYDFLRLTENVLQKKKLTYFIRSASQIQNIESSLDMDPFVILNRMLYKHYVEKLSK